MSDKKFIWVISSGSYSDYRVNAAFDSKKTAKAVAARANASEDGYREFWVESLPYFDDPNIQRVETLSLHCEIWDSGKVDESDPWYRIEWPFDALYEIVDCRWRWVRAPIHKNLGGRLEVSGTNHELVRKVYGEKKSALMYDDALRSRGSMSG